MQTKYILYINGNSYELQDDDLKNWGDIQCSYKRADYGGVVRSFTSQFEFVNKAKELLLEAYLRDRYNAKASISVLTMNDRWLYKEQFRCPLDFSSVQWENGSMKINGIDSGVASMIKANKSTTYEFAVGTDIISNRMLNFDRVSVQESVTYGFTGGTSFDDCADMLISIQDGIPIWVGNIGDEIPIGGSIYWCDDQTPENPYLISAVRDVTVNFEWEISWRRDLSSGASREIAIYVIRNGVALPPGDGVSRHMLFLESYKPYIDEYVSPDDLPDASQFGDNPSDIWAIVNGMVWTLSYRGYGYYWRNENKTPEEYHTMTGKGSFTLNLKEGDRVALYHSASSNGSGSSVRILKSRFVFSWLGRGEPVNIPVFRPADIATAILRKMSSGSENQIAATLSKFDARLANTYIFAAECARGLINAKLYSSFNNFCDWMSTVFGYVYYIEEGAEPIYKHIRVCGQIEGSPWAYEDSFCGSAVNTDDIVYIPAHAMFLYHADGKLYTRWIGCEEYNDPATGHPRTDTLFYINEISTDELHYFDEYTGGPLYPQKSDVKAEDVGRCQDIVHFVHRSEIMKSGSTPRIIKNCVDLKYSVDKGQIYSAVKIGYDKKNYESINGRDEFNFNNTYSTGCTVNEKTLSMLSKYRADCYGIEFAVQKQGEETTDSTSDKDVFFILCKNVNDRIVIDRDMVIENALSGSVFNGAFSPMACLKANAGYIGMQADVLDLTFASSDGNSDIIIDGTPVSADIRIDTPLCTCGEVSFSTDDISDIQDTGELIQIIDNGMIYRGFLKELDLKYARTEAAKYKLIVKEVELC